MTNTNIPEDYKPVPAGCTSMPDDADPDALVWMCREWLGDLAVNVDGYDWQHHVKAYKPKHLKVSEKKLQDDAHDKAMAQYEALVQRLSKPSEKSLAEAVRRLNEPFAPTAALFGPRSSCSITFALALDEIDRLKEERDNYAHIVLNIDENPPITEETLLKEAREIWNAWPVNQDATLEAILKVIRRGVDELAGGEVAEKVDPDAEALKRVLGTAYEPSQDVFASMVSRLKAELAAAKERG